MTLGITGISPIGLGLGTSSYSDYSNYMPSMMGLSGAGGYGGSGYGSGSIFGGYGMMGMMGGLAEYQMYLQQMQNQLDLNNLDHTRQMHAGMISNETQAHEDRLSGWAQQLLADASVQTRVMTLYRKIREGDQVGANQEYDKLKARVYETFDQEIADKGIVIGRADEARRLIAVMYGQLISNTVHDGQTHTLEGDIDLYCDNAFKTGFVSGFRGQGGRQYRDETINHIYGTRIDNVKSKNGQKILGSFLGGTASVFRDIIGGAALGAGTWTAGVSAISAISLLCGKVPSWWKFVSKGAGWAAIAGVAAMGAYDVIKRIDNKPASSNNNQ